MIHRSKGYLIELGCPGLRDESGLTQHDPTGTWDGVCALTFSEGLRSHQPASRSSSLGQEPFNLHRFVRTLFLARHKCHALPLCVSSFLALSPHQHPHPPTLRCWLTDVGRGCHLTNIFVYSCWVSLFMSGHPTSNF